MSDTNHPEDPHAVTTAPRGASDTPHPLDDLIASIRAAVAPDASPAARAAGATACRSILSALEAQVGQPLAALPPLTTTASTSPIAAVLKQMAAMPREQLIEFLLHRLRSALPPGVPTTPVPGAPRFHLIQLPPPRRPGS